MTPQAKQLLDEAGWVAGAGWQKKSGQGREALSLNFDTTHLLLPYDKKLLSCWLMIGKRSASKKICQI